MAQGIGDEKELQDQAKLARATTMSTVKDEREKAQRLQEGQAVIEKKKNILKSQMGTIGSNYSIT